jgi:hypothetical protein
MPPAVPAGAIGSKYGQHISRGMVAQRIEDEARGEKVFDIER